MKHDKLFKNRLGEFVEESSEAAIAHHGWRSLQDAACQELGGDGRNAATVQPQPLPPLLPLHPSAPRSGSVRGRILRYVFQSYKIQLFLGGVVSR